MLKPQIRPVDHDRLVDIAADEPLVADPAAHRSLPASHQDKPQTVPLWTTEAQKATSLFTEGIRKQIGLGLNDPAKP